MDELKKYIQSHQAQLQKEEPRSMVWESIQESLHPPVKKLPLRNWAIAASLILIAGSSVLFWRNSNQENTTIVKTNLHEQNKPIEKTIEAPTQMPITASNQNHQEKSANFPAASIITTIHTVKELNAEDQSKLISTEASFSEVINLQKARISTTPLYAESPKYFSSFQNQLLQMENDEKQIKSYIKKNGMTDELLDQLINVYQQKLYLLKQLQNEMQKLNSRFKQNRPAVDTLKTYFLNL